ncbi:MAG: hypothetical protein U5P10_05625 [Spirochaetia bacterium]|nr:hypothetical protein [Spirochaetia bacterium]
MILRFYRRGTEGSRGQACVECAAEGTGGRQLLLDFEEDRICIVRQVQRNGCIGGSRPWSAPEGSWPGGPLPGGLRWPRQGSAPGNDDCA